MKASELMIGNKIMFGERVIDVTGYDIMNIYKAEVHKHISESAYQYIPLTPEWLEKLGFNKWGGQQWFVKKYTALEGEDFLDKVYLEHEVEVLVNLDSKACNIQNITHDEQGASTKCKIGYVHELQRLWYSLTGEELKEKGC